MGFAKILIVYLCISMVLMVGTYNETTGTYMRPTEMLSDFLGISGTNESLTVVKGEGLNATINETRTGGGIRAEAGQIIDDLNIITIIWSFFKLLFDLWWLPVAVMVDIRAPFPLVLISAIFPILFITYLYSFIRSGGV